MQRYLKHYWPALVWALFVFMMCAVNLGSVSNSPIFFPGFDKLVHCGFFFVLIILYCAGAIRQQSPPTISYKYVILVTLAAIGYGGIIELLQLVIFTWRSADWNDLFADAVGACMGAYSVLVIINAANYVEK